MCVGFLTAGTWSSFQSRLDNEFETDMFPTIRILNVLNILNDPKRPAALARRGSSPAEERETEGADERYRIFTELAEDAIDELGETSVFGVLTERLRAGAANARSPAH
jgi:hypothetical protein